MSYPLSTRSSKKSKKTPGASSSVILERSACQNSKPETLQPEEYRHILAGDRVFIELYYQGRVITTAYNEWIPFMGGILSKRLIPKVTIFLTNLEPHEIGGVRERVKKICPQCRIVNILWFQQCFQQKQKIPFDEYALDLEVEKSEHYSEQPKDENLIKEINELLTNIAEDADLEFKQFFKMEKNKFFEPLTKNATKTQRQIITAREIDLGQNPNKKPPKPKNENKKRGKSFSRQIKPDTILFQQPRESKSLGEDIANNLPNEEEQCDSTQTNDHRPQQLQENRATTLQNIMSKYLGINYQNKTEGQQQDIDKQKKSLIKSGNSQARSKQRGKLYKKLEKQPSKQQDNYTQIITNAIQPKKYIQKQNHRMTFSVLGTKYKNINLEEDITSFTPFEIERSINLLSKRNDNCLIVLTPSQPLEQKIDDINMESNHHSAIFLHKINVKHFAAISERIEVQKEAFFLLNPKKAVQRAFFIALKSQTEQSKLKIKLVNYRLVQQVIAYNTQIKISSLRTPIKLQKNRLKFMKQLVIKVDRNVIRGKKIAFLQSELPIINQKKLIELLGGEYVFKQDYLLSAHLDIIITDRWGLKEKGTQTMKEQDFWKKIFKLEGEP